MKKLFVLLVISLLSSNISLANSLKIIDGDTIVLNGEKIRFEGIDTPELKQTCLKDNEEVKCGMLAKILLIEKIGNNIPGTKIKIQHENRIKKINKKDIFLILSWNYKSTIVKKFKKKFGKKFKYFFPYQNK